MTFLQRIFLILFCVCFISGCYEDEAEITLNSDGSGTLKQKLVLSERLIVSTSNGGDSQGTPPASKEKVLEEIGPAIDVKSIKQTELPDGGRAIEFQGTFSNAEQFFLSEFCRDTLKLRIAPAGDGKAAIYCDIWQTSNDASGPSTTRLYGMAKGLHIKRTVHLPAKIEKTNGYRGKDKNTVSWVIDLRNKKGLARTKAFEESEDERIGSAVFDASALGFTLPLKTAAPSDRTIEAEKRQPSQEPAGLKAEVSWVAINKKLALDSNSTESTISDLEFGIKVSWSEDHKPFACLTPVMTSLQDDLNNDLVKSAYQSTLKIYGTRTEKDLKIKTKTPGRNVKKLKNLEGYVPVVTSVDKEKVILENIQELAGREEAANPVLDKLNFRIKSIQGTRLKIEIDGGHNTITSLDIFGKDGSKVKSRGGSGWGNNYSYDFADDISKLNKCQIEVVVSQNTVKVPFSLEETSLP